MLDRITQNKAVTAELAAKLWEWTDEQIRKASAL
jgi:hypothetical protein